MWQILWRVCAVLLGIAVVLGTLPGESSPADLQAAHDLGEKADLLYLKAEYPEAESLYRLALENQEGTVGTEHPEYAGTLAKLARLTWEWKCEYEQADQMFEQAVGILEKHYGPDHVEVATVLAMWGEQLRVAGDYAESERMFLRALDVMELALGSDHPDVAMALLELSKVYHTRGRNWEAVELRIRTLSILENTVGTEHPHYALALLGRGLSSWRPESNTKAALDAFAQAVDILESTVGLDHPWTAYALNYLGNLSSFTGDPERARPCLKRALSIREKVYGPDHTDTAMSANNLGNFYRATLEYDKAENLFLRAAEIWERLHGQDHYLAAGVYANIADIRMARADYSGAQQPVNRAHRGLVASLGEDHQYVTITRRFQAILAWIIDDDRSEARRLLEYNKTILESMKRPSNDELAKTLDILGLILEEEPEEWRKARGYYERALAIRQEIRGPNHPAVRSTLEALARLDARAGKTKEAALLALRSEDIRRNHILLTSRLASERDALRYSQQEASGLDLALTLVPTETGLTATVWDSVIRSRALIFDEMAMRSRELGRANNPEISALFHELGKARARLAHLTVLGMDQGTPNPSRSIMEQARSEKERIERELAAFSLLFREEQAQHSAGFDQIRKALPPDTALVAYVRYFRQGMQEGEGVPSYLAFLLPSAQADPVLVDLGEAAEIDAGVEAVRREASYPPSALLSAGREAERRFRAAGTTLGELIWNPISPHVQNSRRVLVVPDGALHHVNFAALPVPGERYLLEVGPELHMLSSEKDLIAPLPQRSGEGLLLVGAADFDGAPTGTEWTSSPRLKPESPSLRGSDPECVEFRSLKFGPLPGTRKEVNAITALWSRHMTRSGDQVSGKLVSLVGPEAHETRVKEAAPGRRIVHLATHGFFLDGHCVFPHRFLRGIGSLVGGAESEASPLVLSGLALAGANHRNGAVASKEDGILTAEEVASLPLTGIQWAVLSGCDTGKGAILPGEGVLGLQRAFRIAGAQTVIMSLYPVQDESTMAWMEALYRARLVEGLSTSAAVRQASRAVLAARREAGKTTHPFYWGAFIASGDWR